MENNQLATNKLVDNLPEAYESLRLGHYGYMFTVPKVSLTISFVQPNLWKLVKILDMKYIYFIIVKCSP